MFNKIRGFLKHLVASLIHKSVGLVTRMVKWSKPPVNTKAQFVGNPHIVILLSELDVEVYFAPVRGYHLLNAGVHPMINMNSDDEVDEKGAEKVVQAARRLICEASISPKIVREFVEPRRGEIPISKISDGAVMYVFNRIIALDTSNFYGANRAAFDMEKNQSLITAQEQISCNYDALARRYGVTPAVVESWSHTEIARTNEIMNAAIAVEIREKQKADFQRKRNR